MEVLANIDLLQHLVRPKANTKAAIAPKAQGGGDGGNTSSNTTTTTNNNNSRSTSDPETWTAEDDAQLRDLKTNSNMSWKQVLAALSDKHTSETQMKARWKEIEGKAVGGAAAGGVGGGGGDDDKAKKEEERKAKAEKAKAEGLAKQAAAEAGKGGVQPKKGNLKVGGSLPPPYLPSATFLEDMKLTHPPHRPAPPYPRHPKKKSSKTSPRSTTKTSG